MNPFVFSVVAIQWYPIETDHSSMFEKHSTPVTFVILGVIIAAVVWFQYESFRGSSPIPLKTTLPIRTVQTTNAVKHSVPLNELVSGGILKDGITPIDEPRFESVAVSDQYLNNDGLGIAIEKNGAVKFYPYQILVWHHAVNDLSAGDPILVSFNPLTFAGSVFERTVSGSVLDFGISDRVYNNNLLLYDRKTQSLWDPMLRQAIVGDLTGISLSFFPFTILTWNDFKSLHPNGNVLSRKSETGKDYTHNPYERYYTDQRMLFPVSPKDERLSSKELIVGLETTQGWKAYPIKQIEKDLTILDKIGNLSVSIEKEKSTSIIHVYLVDANGSHTKELPFVQSYWFAWAAAYPQTDLYLQK